MRRLLLAAVAALLLVLAYELQPAQNEPLAPLIRAASIVSTLIAAGLFRLAGASPPKPKRPCVYHWLHLSDIHFGAARTTEWPYLADTFERDLKERLKRLKAPIDLILLSGDLTDRGTDAQFEGFHAFLERLLALIEEHSSRRPIVIPVPGNHDLVRVTEDKLKARGAVEEDYNDTPYLDARFRGYTRWRDDRILPQLRARSDITVHTSPFPGDLSVVIDDPDRFKLVVVGLNSAWLHDRDVKEGELALLPHQLHTALGPGENPLSVFPSPPRALLMHHHPPTWLAQRDHYERLIHDPNRFAACLYGHMHVARGSSTRTNGGPDRNEFQAPSLFGLEDYGTPRVSRSFGYAFGMIGSDGEIRLWPYLMTDKGNNVWNFDRDLYWTWINDSFVRLRSADPSEHE